MGKHKRPSNGDTYHYRSENGHTNGQLIPEKIQKRLFGLDEIQAGRPILKAKTPGQQEYLDTINASIVTFCAGCAGTGKTYMATARAIELYKSGEIKKILLTRPAVSCGKGLGFLPGELDAKFSVFTRPFETALTDFLDPKELKQLLEDKTIDIQPLDYLRGSTFNDTFMILDEAQNATLEQLKMFMYRIGKNSRMVITGDTKQTDLNSYEANAFSNFFDKAERKPYIDGINTAILTVDDCVRSGILRQMIEKFGE